MGLLERLRSATRSVRQPEPELLRTRSVWQAGTASERQGLAWDFPSDFAVNQNVELIRRRARHMARNTAIGARATEAFQNAVAGAGIKPLFKSKARKGLLQSAWKRFVDNADRDRLADFYLLQASAVRHWLVDGECLILRILADDGSLQLQLLPAEFLDSTLTSFDQHRIVSGVQFDGFGARTAYHVFQSHPSDLLRMPISKRIPASEVIHLRRTEMVGQVRGVSIFAPVLSKMNDLDQFDRSTLVKAKTNALFCGFLHGQDGNPLNAQRSNDGAFTASIEPGSLVDVGASEVSFTPHADTGPYSEFAKTQLRLIASGMGLPYSVLTGDLSDNSYNSARVGRIDFSRQIERMQWDFIHQACRPVMIWWLQTEVLAGRLPLPEDGIQSYLDEITWAPPPLPMLDPQRETAAAVAEIRAGLKTREMTLAERGYDRDEVDEEIRAGNVNADLLGLVFDTDPRMVTVQGQQQQGASPTEAQAD